MSPKTPDARTWPEIDWLNPNARVEPVLAAGWYVAIKPLIDFAIAATLSIPALPVIGACWVLIKLTSAGPGFYCQTRAGRWGRPYQIIKLRTMRHGVEASTGIQWSQHGDCRVTAIGKLLRTTHLDELPQLINVLRGEMSLVGPRPERPEMIRTKGLPNRVPGYEHRLDVKPGVTGLAQVQLPADSDITSVRHKIVYDLYYLGHQSLWLDLRLMAATLMKAAGLRPTWLRRLFLLPGRERVAKAFRSRMNPPPPPTPVSTSRLQTA